ncbi:NAD(P)H-binding protein [Vitiosangium sp. GDMCC 1.1324]|uniref:NAD(P)H-binding protein n=1 Tax=Vitiosangium sp. (strain GDMCC 1.1324) TaxID=2138576 RepID=UPI000D39AA37|nr:NAD(P)H-binding protein [Vitiosangium sp. GDMCC 1.1324]PTL80102.1 NmrA family protein [Vitiosangium sp. GDMCC 1.1324]
MSYIITGATGNIGRRVVGRLLEAGIRPRVLTRDAEKARKSYGEHVDIRVGDLSDPASLRPAFTGGSTLFLVNAGPDLAARDAAAVQVARAVGVTRVMKLSSLDVEQEVGTGVWHARGELALRESGLSFTFLRPSGFMSNALGWAPSIRGAGLVRTSTGEGRIALIHPDDIAEVATHALLRWDYEGQALRITGPEALSYAEMTARISAVIGEPLVFQSMSDQEARALFVARREEPEMVAALLSIWSAIRGGRLDTVTETVRHVLGRGPRSFEAWARENAASFRDGSG